MSHRITRHNFTDVSEECAASIFKVDDSAWYNWRNVGLLELSLQPQELHFSDTMTLTHARIPRGWDKRGGGEATSSEGYNGGPLYLHDKRLAHCAAGDNITLNRSRVINLPFYQQNPSSYVAAAQFCPLQRSWTLNEKTGPRIRRVRNQSENR